MRFAHIALVTVAAASFVSCSSTRVTTDWDRQASFGTYTTFSWREPPASEHRPGVGASQIVDGRIRAAIAHNITAKGYTQVDPGEADLEVAYYTSLSTQLVMYNTGWGYGWGYGPRWGFGYSFWPGWTTTTVSEYHEGTIIIDVVDRERNQLVWRGVVTSAVSKKSASQEKIDQAMTRVLADFPAR